MSRLKTAVLALSVLAGACLLPLSYSAQATEVKADSGIADVLNWRYQQTVDECSGKSAFYCSGVMARVVFPGANAFLPDTDERASFTYLRKDITTFRLFGPMGFIFSNQFEAINKGNAIPYACGFPYDAQTNDRQDSSLGGNCGTDTTLNGEPVFYDSCAAAGVTDQTTWLLYMEEPGRAKYFQFEQCAFDSNKPSDFKTLIKVHDLGFSGFPDNINQDNAWTYTEVTTQAWKEGQSLPIEAFFYNVNKDPHTTITVELAREYAFQLRDQYKAETGIDLDVVGIDFTNQSAPFVTVEQQ